MSLSAVSMGVGSSGTTSWVDSPQTGRRLHCMFSCCFSVATQILKMKQHLVPMGTEYRIRVEAQPVELVVPKQVEVQEPAGNLPVRP